ncbi:lysine--tRNA ligase [Candidatus Woesearchaeota archaeon]|nr:lysine--tRNA ligase [Candidatus Woesearchaeota archaeon]
MEPENKLIKERIDKLKEIRDSGVEPYPYIFDQKHHSNEIKERYKDLEEGQSNKKAKLAVAGRIMLKREMGKASFVTIRDQEGDIQLYFRQDDVGKEAYDLFKKLDLGDIIGANGYVFKTKRGEITVYVTEFQLLTKTIRPLPEKFHGLQDPELRYRMRYVDLIMNPEVREVFRNRALIISSIREYLDKRGFLEVDTPCIQPIYGGAAARPFKTHLNALNMEVYLRISNELYLKRLIVGGFEKVYEFARDFRNEGIDRTHNPEFTQVELYQAYADYNDMMKIMEELWAFCAQRLYGTTKIKYQNEVIDLTPPWRRLTMVDAIKEYADIDVTKLSDEELFDLRITYNIDYEGELTRGMMIQLLFEELCEDKLVQPVFIIHHPVESTPLCKTLRNGDTKHVERFEPYIFGMEIGNAYSELNDPIRQRELLEEQAEQLRGGAEEAHPMDEDFIRSIEYGMPPTGGMGVGVDRMVMILTNQDTVREVILFPFMREEQ